MRTRGGFAKLGLALALAVTLATPVAAATGDADRDGLADAWERKYWGSVKAQNAKADADADGLSNLLEQRLKGHPAAEDTDRDGSDDGDEVKLFKTKIGDRDGDDDGMPDGDEDSDHDGVTDEDSDDAVEPCGKADDDDADRDGLDDEDENELGHRVGARDSDGDGIADGDEDSGGDGEADEDADDATDTCDKDFDPKGPLWQQSDGGWSPVGTVPSCRAQPLLAAPTDLDAATSVLYPGQTRGGNYKPHGGLRLDGTPNDEVLVKAPLDGFIVRGARYIEMGEIQYILDVMNNCGVMYRFDHLRALPDRLQAMAAAWPEAKVDDTRTHGVNPPLYVKQGQTIATAVGFIEAGNTSFDWGVYDFRQQNEASQSPAYRAAHPDRELSWHAVCWFDWVPAADAATVRALPPADPTSGTTSDYCD